MRRNKGEKPMWPSTAPPLGHSGMEGSIPKRACSQKRARRQKLQQDASWSVLHTSVRNNTEGSKSKRPSKTINKTPNSNTMGQTKLGQTTPNSSAKAILKQQRIHIVPHQKTASSNTGHSKNKRIYAHSPSNSKKLLA